MIKVWFAPIAALVVSLGCNVSTEAPKESSGNVQLTLLGSDSTGAQYRLRNANFTIEGYPEYFEGGVGGTSMTGTFITEVSSETDPESPVITQRVVPGFYYVTFTSTEWYLEELTPAGPARVEQAVLLSSRFQANYVYDGGTTPYTYRFGVDGELIDFRAGNVEINIEIERPEDEPGGGFGGSAGTGAMGGFPNAGSFGMGIGGTAAR